MSTYKRMKTYSLIAQRWMLLGIIVASFRIFMLSPGAWVAQMSIQNERILRTNKALVILMGNLRGGEKAWETLYANVLPQDSGSADLALIVQDNFTNYPNASLLNMAKYVWTFPGFDDWADALDLVNGTEWRETHLPKFRAALVESKGSTILFGPLKGFAGSGMLIFMIRWFLVEHLKEHDIVNKYDRFVITRTDHFYFCRHEFSKLDLRDNTIWVPEGEEWGGYTDRHLVVGRENLFDALDIMPQLIGKPFEYDESKHHNTERFIKFVWMSKSLNVKKFPRVMFTCGTDFDAGWRKAAWVSGIPGVFAKYKDEFFLARRRCGLGE
mmetsp:Transcript_31333/g.66686  ORF Transcript_31333/g.66686 Transcript_31333/m.66686 type:complete len:326 (-) Transcript_31333:471-1448(-)